MKLIDKDDLVAWAKETYLCENASMIRKVCYKQLLEYLDTLEVKEMKEEPVSKDLEEAAKDQARSYGYMTEDYEFKENVEAFKAGAKWKKEKFIEKACEFFENHLCCYIKAQDFTIEHLRLEQDFKKYMEDEL